MIWEKDTYKLLPGWAARYCTQLNYNRFIKTLKCDKPFKDDVFRVLSHHMIYDMLEPDSAKLDIINLVNSELELNVKRVEYSITMMTDQSGLNVHNDYYPERIDVPARGIIYINPTKVFGTSLHDYYIDETDTIMPSDNCTELGGSAGDFLFFKTSPTTFHSAGFKNNPNPRFTLNLLFYNR